jgi:dsRNA-specific ribonuclease
MEMSAPANQAILALRIGYEFRDESLLNQALTAAGAREDIYDGNRTLAQIGKAFVDLASTRFGYTVRTNPGKYCFSIYDAC